MNKLATLFGNAEFCLMKSNTRYNIALSLVWVQFYMIIWPMQINLTGKVQEDSEMILNFTGE